MPGGSYLEQSDLAGRDLQPEHIVIFVPTPVTPPAPLSPRARELADLLSRVIQEYEKHHPSVTGSEVRTALQAAARSSKSASAATSVGLALALGVLVFLLVFGLYVYQAGSAGGEGGSFPMIAVAVTILLALGLLVALKSMRRP